MASNDLTQSEADALIAMEKRRVDDKIWRYVGIGGSISVPLTSTNGSENFVLDLRRGRINLGKGSYQNRARRVVPLVRLCFGGAPHRNPDDAEVGSPHLHIYHEGYADRWAMAVPGDRFTNLDDQWQTYQDFLGNL